MAGALWNDWELRRDGIFIKKTGAALPYTLDTFAGIGGWFKSYLAATLLRLSAAASRRRPIRVAFAPDEPRPWYLLWNAARAAGTRFVRPEDADVVVFFDDATRSAPPPVTTKPGARLVNFSCGDVSKTRVAAVFEAVFGYPLALDPSRWSGPAVEKSEANGAHDGRVVECPCEPRPGYVYQRVVANSDDDEVVEDLRCPTVAGAIPLVFVKRRAIGRRFANFNDSVALERPEEHFAPEERARLSQFTRAMGLDWGGLDVLRDRRDGRLYVVDVNKTDMGPPTALPLADQVRAILRLGKAFRTAFESPSDHGR